MHRLARRFFVSGRVQGVGYRWFVEKACVELGLTGYARNLADGRVEVYAAGSSECLAQLTARLSEGPRAAQVRQVEEMEAEVEDRAGFRTY